MAESNSNPPARRVAMTVLFILLVGSAVSSTLTLNGRGQQALYSCAFTAALVVIVLVLGSLIVASSREK